MQRVRAKPALAGGPSPPSCAAGRELLVGSKEVTDRGCDGSNRGGEIVGARSRDFLCVLLRSRSLSCDGMSTTYLINYVRADANTPACISSGAASDTTDLASADTVINA